MGCVPATSCPALYREFLLPTHGILYLLFLCTLCSSFYHLCGESFQTPQAIYLYICYVGLCNFCPVALSPLYNHTDWLGVKHQPTYLLAVALSFCLAALHAPWMDKISKTLKRCCLLWIAIHGYVLPVVLATSLWPLSLCVYSSHSWYTFSQCTQYTSLIHWCLLLSSLS